MSINDLIDKNAVMQVIGCIMENPLLLAQIDKYHLDKDDFNDRFTKNLFVTIYNIFQNGAKHIEIVDIDNFLNSNKDVKQNFEKNNGIQYLQDCIDLHDSANFDYYYSRLKKFSALRALKQKGFDISDIYCEDILAKNYNIIQNKFEELTVQEIFDNVKKKIFDLENKYETAASREAINANKGLKELKNSLKLIPDIGNPLQGVLFDTVTRGARHGKFYLRSSLSGNGKTRLALGDACYLAFPERYNTKKQSWEKRKHFEKVLFITTELTEDEIQTMILSWVSGINEGIILSGQYIDQEEEIVDTAIQIIEKYRDNFIIKQISDPSISAIEACVRQQVLTNGIQSVFYDYIFSSPSLFNEFKGAGVREDER